MKDQQASYPQLRFKGFTDPWEERKLSSISERVTRKNKNNESTLPLTISAQDGLVDQNDFFNKQVASRDVTGYFLVKNGEFAYNKSYSNGYPWGAIKRLDKYDMGVLSTLYIVFRPTKINSQFLVSYYDTTRWYREVSKNAAEGARNHGLLNIAPTDFFNTLLVVPKIVDEQQKIGSFFKQLDDTIALHQRKLAKLKELKQGYLQKLFPRNGSKFPQLRFAGFADAWEQRKLGELGKIYTGNTPKTSDLDNWTDNKEGHIWITPTDIHKLIMSDSDRHLSEQGWSKARKIPENSVLITSIASIGKNTINAVPVAFNQQINAIVPEKNDSYFILSAMIKDTARFASVAGQTATAIINKTTFEKFQIATPSYEEQQKIGLFFKQLDNTIDLHQRKLEKLQELKKGYLQKMFC